MGAMETPNRNRGKPVQKSRRRRFLEELLYLILKITAIILAGVLVFTFLFGAFRVSDASMAPSIKEGDLVLFYRLDKYYVSGNAIVLKYNGRLQSSRVIAVAGDEVDITDSGLMINGALQSESNIYEETQRYNTAIEFPLTVPEGEVFVLGDGRENATDSRVFGTVKIEDTLGKVMTVIRRRGI
jgi:signal peptidase I